MPTPRNNTKVCTALASTSIEDFLFETVKSKEIGADLVDFRLDHLKEFNPDLDLPRLLKEKVLPAIISFRPKDEGGLFEGPEDFRVGVLQKAVELGFEYVDVELKIAEGFIKSLSQDKKTQVIVSSHNFKDTPPLDELIKTADEIHSTKADIAKIVTTANNVCDCKRLFQLLECKKLPTIAFALGIRGEITRELAPKYDAFLTYGPLEESHESSGPWNPPSIGELINCYLLRIIGKESKVFGVCANPVGHSKSPLLLNAAMVETGVDGIYVPFLVDDIKEFFATYTDFSGFSVTLPHKSVAVECCEEVDPTARAIGAVNNVKRRDDGTLFARNTDWGACTSAIEDGLREREGLSAEDSPLEGRLLVLAGAGGAGRALAFGATQKGAIMLIADLDQNRAAELAGLFNGHTCKVSDLQVPNAAAFVKGKFLPHSSKAPVLAHMTPVGMVPKVENSLFTKEMLEGFSVVFDAVYTPSNTKLLQNAKQAGCTPVSGVEMFVRQGADQFFNFTDRMPSKDIMREKLLAAVNH